MKLSILIFGILCGTHFLSATQYSEIVQEYLALAKQAQEKNNTALAQQYISYALRLEPDNAELQQKMLIITVDQHNYEKALHYAKAIQNKYSGLASAWNNVGYCLKMLGRTSEAIPFYEKAIALRPDHFDARQTRAECLLKLGKYQEAWPEYELRFRPARSDTQKFVTYMQTNGDLRNKKILLHNDFGMGDVFQFIRFAQIIKQKGAYIILMVQEALVPLLKLCPYIDEVYGEKSPTPAHDFSTVLMSLPYVLNISLKEIPQSMPYLYSKPELFSNWQKQFKEDKKFKIGICWNTNSYNTKLLQELTSVRCIPLRLLHKLSSIPDVSFYSLQKITGIEQLKNLPKDFVLHTFNENFDETNGRFMDTAAVMQNLDLVLTIDTSIAHLAGALGVQTWLMLPCVADWRWMEDRHDSVWYPTMKLFRQSKPDDWQSVIESIYKELEKKVTLKVKQ